MPDLSEHDDRYCYPRSDVLINHFNVRDAERLRQLERVLSGARLVDLYRKPLKGRFDFAHLKAIHAHLFQDIYPFAGEVRTVDIAKGLFFCHYAYIEDEAKRIFRELKEEGYLADTPLHELALRCAYYLGEINALHPFRDGNGRAQRECMRELLLVKRGLNLDFTKVPPEAMFEASVASFKGDDRPLIVLFRECLNLSYLEGTPVNQH